MQDRRLISLRRQMAFCETRIAALLERLPPSDEPADHGIWTELYGLLDLRRRFTETEGKNIHRMHNILTAEQAHAFVAAVLASLKKHVTDQAALAAIGADCRRLLVGRVGAEEPEGER